MSGLIDPTTRILTKALDGLSARQSLISSNLANIDTPGYLPKTVDFETALKSEVASLQSGGGLGFQPTSSPAADVAMKTTSARQYSGIGNVSGDSSMSTDTTSESIRNDDNQVDLETEMTALTQNQIKYSAESRLITAKFGQLYSVLGGR
jgi:flagellar basal-body rod protein FlgB